MDSNSLSYIYYRTQKDWRCIKLRKTKTIFHKFAKFHLNLILISLTCSSLKNYLTLSISKPVIGFLLNGECVYLFIYLFIFIYKFNTDILEIEHQFLLYSFDYVRHYQHKSMVLTE